MKIVSESSSLPEVRKSYVQKLFSFRPQTPPLPFFLSLLLKSKPHPKLSSDVDIDLDDPSDQEEEEEEEEYDRLPPFHPLTKSQIANLTKLQKGAYFDEYDYRVKLLKKKQWRQEIRRLKEMKKMNVYDDAPEDFDDSPAPAAASLPDVALPPSFDSDYPAYLFRALEPSSQFSTGPIITNPCWDHDYGLDGVSLEKILTIMKRFPAEVSVKLRKDKKDFTLHLDSSVSAKHGDRASSLANFEVQTIGEELAYILRGETKFRNFKRNKSTAGVLMALLGETVGTGVKLEDQVSIGKRVDLTLKTGAVRARGATAYEANLEAVLREDDYPLGQALATFGLSLAGYQGSFVCGGTLRSELSVGRNSRVAARVGMNNEKCGQIAIMASSSDQHQTRV